MYGTKGRLGVISIASSVVMEEEYQAIVPPSVTLHSTRIKLGKADLEGLSALTEGDQLEKCTELLAQAPLNSILFGCTAGSLLGGLEYERRFINKMNSVSNSIPVSTTAIAVRKALDTLEIRKITMATPYVKELLKPAKKWLEEAGFEVLHIEGLGISNDIELGNQTLERVGKLALNCYREEADALLIACTNFKSAPLIGELEEKLRQPVVTYIQASLWESMRIGGIKEKVKGYGKLLREF